MWWLVVVVVVVIGNVEVLGCGVGGVGGRCDTKVEEVRAWCCPCGHVVLPEGLNTKVGSNWCLLVVVVVVVVGVLWELRWIGVGLREVVHGKSSWRVWWPDEGCCLGCLVGVKLLVVEVVTAK